MLHEKIPRSNLKTKMEYEADSQVQRNKRKRGSKSEEVIDILVELMRDMKGAYQEHTSVLVDIISCFKHEKKGAERRMKLMALLRDVPSLSDDDRMKASLSILRDNSLIDMVFQLQLGELLPFLKKLL
ncbi:hypothetical protein Ahy_A03g013669 isoform A [Arachis hypogaea]|uniref:Uncharacterized protein n=1 Tax=Arachis hypogaea TaxID=3818 RepID=A0A445DVZ7_ARAHY|nr:hypothetical protein Ahy_A03g013669 isoform A [Arachis hypogaea]